MTTELFNSYLDIFKSHASQCISSFKRYPIWKQALVSSAIMIGSGTIVTLASYYCCKIRYGLTPKIYNTITGDINNNAGIIIFIHGFPDFDYLWENQIEYFSKKNYCCINLELPNFNINRIQNPWGYDFFTIIDALALKIKEIVNNKTCILFTHDWGAFIGELLYLNYKTEINFDKLILLDVADGSDPDPSEMHKYTYQFYCAASFLMPQWFGSWYLKRYFVRLISADPNVTFPVFEKEKRENKTYFHSTGAYLYYYVLKAAFSGQSQKLSVTERLNEFDGLPILFIDGNKGDDPVRFYTTKFKQFIDERDYCKFVEFDCYHWIMTEKPNELNETVYQFLQK